MDKAADDDDTAAAAEDEAPLDDADEFGGFLWGRARSALMLLSCSSFDKTGKEAKKVE